MALNQVTLDTLDKMLSDGWRILMLLGRDTNGIVLQVQRKPDLPSELLEVTDAFFLGTHNLLSATHADTIPQSPPLDPSGIIGTDGVSLWTEIDVGAGLTNQVLKGDQGLPVSWSTVKALLPGSLIFSESFNEAIQNATVPNVDTVLKTLTLSATLNGPGVTAIVETEGYVQFTALSTLQNVFLKLKRNGVLMGSSLIIDAALGGQAIIPFSLKRVKTGIAGSDVFTLQISGPAADVNTSVFATSLRVFSS